MTDRPAVFAPDLAQRLCAGRVVPSPGLRAGETQPGHPVPALAALSASQVAVMDRRPLMDLLQQYGAYGSSERLTEDPSSVQCATLKVIVEHSRSWVHAGTAAMALPLVEVVYSTD